MLAKGCSSCGNLSGFTAQKLHRLLGLTRVGLRCSAGVRAEWVWLQRREKLLSGVLLGLLAVAWGVLLLPRLFRGFEGGSNVFGIFRSLGSLIPSRRSSRDPMAALSRTASGLRAVTSRSNSGFSGAGLSGGGSYGRSAYGAARGRRANKRRRDVFMGLLFSAIGTALLAVVTGLSMLWKANVVVDVLLLGYVGLLVSARRPAGGARSMNRSSGAGSYRYESPEYQFDYARSEG